MADHAFNIEDLRQAARRRLPRGVFEFIDRATEDDLALRSNREALQHLRLAPRALVDVSRRDLSIELFGARLAMPAMVAPAGPAGLFWHRGEEALALAAKAAGIPYVISSYATTPFDVLARSGATLWCQLYIWNDRRLSDRVIATAREAGSKVLIVTVDTPTVGQREYLDKNGFATPFRLSARAVADVLAHPAWALSVPLRYWLRRAWPQVVNLEPAALGLKAAPPDWSRRTELAQDVTWDEISRLRERWPGDFVLKGILRADDAQRAASIGCSGIVVSNHGGRNLDAALPAISALPDIVAAVGGRSAILLDGGIRRGSDIVKALALGADAVLLGRSVLYGLAAYGRPGADRALQLMAEELDRTMTLVGAPRPADITADLVAGFSRP